MILMVLMISMIFVIYIILNLYLWEHCKRLIHHLENCVNTSFFKNLYLVVEITVTTIVKNKWSEIKKTCRRVDFSESCTTCKVKGMQHQRYLLRFLASVSDTFFSKHFLFRTFFSRCFSFYLYHFHWKPSKQNN